MKKKQKVRFMIANINRYIIDFWWPLIKHLLWCSWRGHDWKPLNPKAIKRDYLCGRCFAFPNERPYGPKAPPSI